MVSSLCTQFQRQGVGRRVENAVKGQFPTIYDIHLIGLCHHVSHRSIEIISTKSNKYRETMCMEMLIALGLFLIAFICKKTSFCLNRAKSEVMVVI